MARSNLNSILKNFAKSNKGYFSSHEDGSHLKTEISLQLDTITGHLESLQNKINSQEILIKSLLRELNNAKV